MIGENDLIEIAVVDDGLEVDLNADPEVLVTDISAYDEKEPVHNDLFKKKNEFYSES